MVKFAAEILKTWLDFDIPRSVSLQEPAAHPDMSRLIGVGITQLGEGGGPIIIPSFGNPGPMPTNQDPSTFGMERVVNSVPDQAPTPGVTVSTTNLPGP